jgi:hypothetical protein
MPTAGVHGQDKAAVIQGYINEGKDIYDRIMNGDYAGVGQADKHDVAKLMWFLQALASGKASESSGDPQGPALFKEGSMFVEDPQGRLEAFLTSANSYPRTSSHMHGYQDMGREYHPHGVDLRNVDTPNERGTVMFARMPQGEAPAGGAADGPRGTGNRRMLFVKMEPHGCRGLTPRGSGTPRDHETPASVWKGVKRFFLNTKDFFMHGMGFIRSIGQRLGLVAVDGQNNRERIPADVKTAYQGIIARAETLGLHAVTTALKARSPLSDAGGIKQMLPNLAQALNLGIADANFREQITALQTTLRNHGDHPELRIGNEVILTQDEMNTGFASPLRPFTSESAPLTVRGGLSGRELEQTQAGREYLLADAAQHDHYVEQFMLDAHRSVYEIGGHPIDRSTPEALEAARFAARTAVLNLTGEQDSPDPRVAKALMTFCHQGLAADITNQTFQDCIATFGGNFSLSDGTYSIDRQPDGADGTQIYRVAYNLDKNITEVNPLLTLPLPDLVPAQSHVRASASLEVRVNPEGGMSVRYPEAPSYEYTLTPARADA